jgi:hypothetical protein
MNFNGKYIFGFVLSDLDKKKKSLDVSKPIKLINSE